jgi:hypothetical protein
VRNEGWIDDNVATGIIVAGYSKTRQRQRTPRLPLRRSMMETLFASPLSTGAEGPGDIERTRPGRNVYQDTLYWAFLCGATAGPRLEEIGQIRLDDIEIILSGEGQQTVAIYVTGTGLDESVKNDESSRVIAVGRPAASDRASPKRRGARFAEGALPQQVARSDEYLSRR